MMPNYSTITKPADERVIRGNRVYLCGEKGSWRGCPSRIAYTVGAYRYTPVLERTFAKPCLISNKRNKHACNNHNITRRRDRAGGGGRGRAGAPGGRAGLGPRVRVARGAAGRLCDRCARHGAAGR